MQNPYSEDQLIEQPAIGLLVELGWERPDCFDEFSQVGGSPLGRETKSEVVLTSRLGPALQRLNPDASHAAVDAAIEELTRPRSAMSLAAANREIYELLKDGVRVSVTDPDGEEESVELLRVIDWNSPANNDFLAASQMWIAGEMYLKRPDLIGFVNGIPLLLMEFKRIDEPVYSAYIDNLRDYKDTIPHLFWYNALIILSNGSESRFGGVTASWEHFAEWKRVSRGGAGGEFVGDDAQGTVRSRTAARPHRKLHALHGGARRTRQAYRQEPSILGREQRHPSLARD